MKGKHVTVLGGGVSGLTAAYFFRKQGIPFCVLEAAERPGGNAVTFRSGGFQYDSGAHRFHDRDPEITKEVGELLGGEWKQIEVPSQVFSGGKYIDFPLSPLDLIKNLGAGAVLKSGRDFLRARISRPASQDDFESHSVGKYGRSLADRFLLGYSEKLWGAPAPCLSVDVAGNRMQGLDLRTFLIEGFRGSRTKTVHLDGAFYYPLEGGIGVIADRLVEACGRSNIRLKAEVTRIIRREEKIEAVEVNGKENVRVQDVVSTIPLTEFLLRLDPSPPERIRALASGLRFRSLVLVAVFLDTPSVTKNASVYFPDPALPFTRLYEPRNRNSRLSPPGKTSVVAEIPCQKDESLWKSDDRALVKLVLGHLKRLGLIQEEDVIGSDVRRLEFAYPVLEKGFREKIRQIREFLGSLANLKLAGRNGLFRYTHIHDQMNGAKGLVDEIVHSGDGKYRTESAG